MAFDLPTLPPTQPDWAQFQIWWQQVVEKIEAQETAQDALLAQIVAAQAAADAAAADAATAQADATAAATTAAAAERNDAISGSWTTPGATLTASDAGSDAAITVAGHTRKYGDATSVAVSGGSIGGLSFSTAYYVYYDDPSRAGGSVSFQATTNANDAAHNAAVGRHFVGKVTTPADGGGSTSGGTTPPGGGGGGGGFTPQEF
jgi:hypothetical protein